MAEKRCNTLLHRVMDGMMLAPTALLGLLITNAHGFDHCAMGEVLRRIRKQGFSSPYLQTMIDNQLNECGVCAKNNVRKTITTPLGHIPTPEGPFRHLVMDYVAMAAARLVRCDPPRAKIRCYLCYLCVFKSKSMCLKLC